MNCETLNMAGNISNQVPQGMRDLKPDKLPGRDSGRQSKTFGSNEGGAVDEAGTSNPSGWRGCQLAPTIL